jgi:hypothetical protein
MTVMCAPIGNRDPQHCASLVRTDHFRRFNGPSCIAEAKPLRVGCFDTLVIQQSLAMQAPIGDRRGLPIIEGLIGGGFLDCLGQKTGGIPGAGQDFGQRVAALHARIPHH